MDSLTSASSGETSWVPPTPWKDLTVDQKLERMREQVQFLQREKNDIANKYYALRKEFAGHIHLERDGRPAKYISEYTESYLSGGLASADSVGGMSSYF